MTQTQMASIILCIAIFISNGAHAQDAEALANPPELADDPALNGDGSSLVDPDDSSADNMADLLNSQQQLQQTFTFRRTINGEVVETDQRTVIYDRNSPSRPTEAGISTLERLTSRFDAEVLTRTEAFDEAKLDFTIADTNQDDMMSIDEFSALVASWRDVDTRNVVDAPTPVNKRQQQYDAFIAEISPETAKMKADKFANEKFLFLTGGMDSVARKDYIREYLLDFDAMDSNKDTILRGNELQKFRALNRGEEIATEY